MMVREDIETVIEAGLRWMELRNQAEAHGLALQLFHLTEYPDQVRQAWELLVSDTPLAGAYPDGEAATPPFTPRQVLMLADMQEDEMFGRPPPWKRTAYYQAKREVREKHGARVESTRCEAQNSRGEQCRAYALPYAEGVRCHTHASREDVQRNRRLRDEERRAIGEVLDDLYPEGETPVDAL